LKLLNDLSAKSPSVEFTSVFSECWPSKASQSILASSCFVYQAVPTLSNQFHGIGLDEEITRDNCWDLHLLRVDSLGF
jgi:hypothetical protein